MIVLSVLCYFIYRYFLSLFLQNLIIILDNSCKTKMNEEKEASPQQEYRQVNFYVHFLAAMAVGGACGNYGLAICLSFLAFIKSISIYEQSKGRTLSEQQEMYFYRAARIIFGGIFGCLTGLVFFPVLLILLTKLKDKRLQINKNSLYMRQVQVSQIPLLLYIVLGFVAARVVLFVDIQMLRAVLLVAFIIAIFVAEIKEYDIEKLATKFQGKQIIKNQDQFSIQILENMTIGYLVIVYSFVNVNLWLCFCYLVWLIASKKVYQKFGFKFSQNGTSTQLSTVDVPESTRSISRALETLTCPISSQLLQNPYTIKECGHTFQKSEIEKSLRIRDQCPLCNTRTSQHSLIENKKIKQIMNQMEKQLGADFLESL